MASGSDKTGMRSNPLKNDPVKKGQSFLQGAMILTIGGIIVKLIGALFKLPITNFLGADGIGYFNTAYQLYLPIYSIATAGFPIAIARMVAENVAKQKYRDVRQIYRASFPIFITTGLVGFGLMFLGAYPYSLAISNPNSVYCILVLAPTVFFCCLMSIYRGYFEGMRNMYPTAISQIIEALCKLIFGIAFAYLFFNTGMESFKAGKTFLFFFNPPTTEGMTEKAANLALTQAVFPLAAAGAIMGVTIGSALGLVYMILYYKKRGDGITKEQMENSPKPLSRNRTIKALIRIAVPIGVGALIVNLTAFIDSSMLQSRLGSLVSNPDSANIITSRYGELLGGRAIDALPNYFYGAFVFALNLYQFVPALAQAFGVSALPAVTTAWATRDKNALKKSIESVVRISALVIIPAGLGLAALAGPILNLLYGSNPDNANAIQIATPILVVLGLAVIGSALSSPFTSMLQAVGRVELPMIFTIITAVIKIGLNYVLVGIPEINVYGAGYGTLFCYIFLLIAEWFALVKITKVAPNFISVFMKPLIAGALCAAAAYASQGFIAGLVGDKIATLAALALAMAVYVIALFLLRGVHKDDIIMLPMGEKIAKALEKRKLIV